MKVKYRKYLDVPDRYLDEVGEWPYNEYEGEVIGSIHTFFGGTRLVVACTDNAIREFPAGEVIVTP